MEIFLKHPPPEKRCRNGFQKHKKLFKEWKQ